jgi:hypothetical protein
MQSSNNSFRDKHTKYSTYINNNKNNILTTLDNKHHEKINEFNTQDEILKKKKKRFKKITKDLIELNSVQPDELTHDIILLKAELKSEIENLEIEIAQINNRTNELDYYDKTIDTLLEYYNPSTKQKQEMNTISYNDIFKQKALLSNGTDKSKLYDKYMKIVHNTTTRKTKNSHTIKLCQKCKIEKTIHVNDGYYTCHICGDSDLILLENDRQSHKDSNAESKACAYKRQNHLSEILNQFQAKESTEIDEDIYKRIKNELTIQRIYDYKTLDYKLMKKILKKLKLNKYYEHIHHIINNLNNMPPPTMTREQEENIKKMFKEIQKPFSLYRPKKRKNFLNYNYIIHKICELYEYDEFLPFFPLLKSRINLEEQDLVWEKICKFKNYEFIPSI